MKKMRYIITIYVVLFSSTFVFAWTEPLNISNTQKRSSFPAITVDNQRNVHVTWAEDFLDTSKIYYTHYNGDSWSTPVDVSRNNTHVYFYGTSLAVDNEGRIHIVWNYNTFDIMWTYCAGDTWSIPVNISNTPGLSACPRTMVDNSGRIHLVWHDNSTGRVEVYYSMYDGESWQEPQRITESTGEEKCFWPDIAVDSSGNPHVVWGHYGGTGSSLDYWIQYSRYDGISWTSPLDILKIDGKPMANGKIAMDSEDLPHVVAEEWQRDSIYYTGYDGEEWTSPYLVCCEASARSPDIEIDKESGMGCIVWTMGYTFFRDTIWDSLVTGLSYRFFPTLASDNVSTLHLVWTQDFEIYYSKHSITGINSQGTDSYFNLEQNFPNPFIRKTVISYQLPEVSRVTVVISDILGRIIEKIDLGYKPAGYYTVPIFINSLKKGGAYAGIYFYTLNAGNFTTTRKMIVVE